MYLYPMFLLPIGSPQQMVGVSQNLHPWSFVVSLGCCHTLS